jgi:DNA-binding beta-propeller fold protein YncE
MLLRLVFDTAALRPRFSKEPDRHGSSERILAICQGKMENNSGLAARPGLANLINKNLTMKKRPSPKPNRGPGFCRPSFVLTCLTLLAFSIPPLRAAPEALVLEAPILVPESKGGFDYLQVDEGRRRLLANHTGNNTLDVFDLDSGQLIKHVATGKAQGVAVDERAGKYYVSVSREKLLVIVDAETLEKTGKVRLDGPADAIVLNPKDHCVYVGHDDATDLWVIDPGAKKLVASIPIPEGPEYLVYDAAGDRVFLNIKSNDSLLVIDPARHVVKEHWATAPARHPHGLAYDPATARLFCAGQNGKLAVMDANSGKVTASVDIAPGIDQIAFDPEKKRIYCASSGGSVSVVEETPNGAVSLGIVKTAPGAKTITFDPKTHAVWIAYATREHSYIRKLTAP